MGYYSAAIAAAASIYGSQKVAAGSAATNAWGIRNSMMNNRFNANQAQKDRLFQSRGAWTARHYNTVQAGAARRFDALMSGTAEQRHVRDLRRAGLNPALAYGTMASSPIGPSPTASAPSGSTARSAGLPYLSNPGAGYANFGQGIASAASLMTQNAQIEQMKASANKMNVEAGTEIPATVKKIASETGLNDARATEVNKNVDMMNLALAPGGVTTGMPGDNSMYKANLGSDTALKALQVQIARMDSQTQSDTMQSLIKARNDMNYAVAIGAKNIHDASDTVWGRVMALFNLSAPLVNSGLKAAGTAATVLQ